MAVNVLLNNITFTFAQRQQETVSSLKNEMAFYQMQDVLQEVLKES